MKARKYLFTITILSFILNGIMFAQSDTINIEGSWLGTLEFVGLRIVFHIKKTSDGYTATLDSPDQGAKDIPTGKVTFAENKLDIDVPVVHGSYSGVYEADKITFIGKWSQGGKSIPLDIKKTDQAVQVDRPQEPKKPYPYNEEDVTFKNENAGVELSGTFTYPKEGNKFIAVLLIPGSGPHNRDEEVMGHKPFLVLSDFLTRHGIAVLRYDDRGVGKSTGNYSSANTKDLASDALAGVNYLKTRKDVKEIGLIGHSEGGIIAPMVADESKKVSFVVLMAAPGIPCDQLLLKQAYLIGKGSGENETALRKTIKLNEMVYNIVKTESDSAKDWSEITKLANEFYATLTDENKQEIGGVQNFEDQLKPVLTPWFRYFIRYNPVPALEKLKCPVLALNGTKDMQVPPEENLSGIKQALTKGGNKHFEIVKLDGLNHLFQTAVTGLPTEYSKISETISPKALEIISDWILKKNK